MDVDVANYLKWLRKAAEGGDTDAQVTLGWEYVNGVRAPKNVDEGRKWLLKAAAKGSGLAMNFLCTSYTEPMLISKGVDANQFPPPVINSTRQNFAEAFSWCLKGANATVWSQSQGSLGWLYARGSADVKPNYEEAYFWFRVGGVKHPFRQALANHFTPEKRAEIETRAPGTEARATAATRPVK